MKVTKAFIKQVVKKIETSLLSTNTARLQLARDLHWAKNVVVWKFTDYRSWAGFLRVHVKMPSCQVYKYIAAVNMIEKYKYTNKDCLTIIAAIGWSNFQFGITDITRKLTVKRFIKTYASPTNSSAKRRDNDDGDRVYTFGLPKEYADQLDLHLINYGMTIHETGRRGVRDAMITLINRKLK